EVVEFRGFGNDVPGSFDPYCDVRQTQWTAHPTLGWAFTPRSDFSIGPIVKYSHTDSTAGFFMASEAPIGIGSYGQGGVQFDLRYDNRDNTRFPRSGVTFTASGSAYPAMWDVQHQFEQLSAVVATYLSAPVLTRPVLALRAGGKKVFGDFPFYEAAFVGGGATVRT